MSVKNQKAWRCVHGDAAEYFLKNKRYCRCLERELDGVESHRQTNRQSYSAGIELAPSHTTALDLLIQYEEEAALPAPTERPLSDFDSLVKKICSYRVSKKIASALAARIVDGQTHQEIADRFRFSSASVAAVAMNRGLAQLKKRGFEL